MTKFYFAWISCNKEEFTESQKKFNSARTKMKRTGVSKEYLNKIRGVGHPCYGRTKCYICSMGTVGKSLQKAKGKKKFNNKQYLHYYD